MKVYVVTTGSYSDYGIDKVFTNKEKAEEYAEWLEDSNDVEEYETDDNVSFEKLHNVHVQMKVYDNGKEDLSYRVYKTKDKCNSYTYLSDYHKYGGDYIDITLSRYVTNENFNEEFYRNKYTKAIYDVLAIIRSKLADGYNEKEINELLNNIESM
jgi:hypothetical protein